MDYTGNSYRCSIIDRDAAIRNMGGLVWLYEKHIRKFLNTYTDSYDRIKLFIICGEIEQARILAHSIKGLSGTLGLLRLHHSAAALEYEIKAHSPYISHALSEYKICLYETIQALAGD